MRAAAVAVLLLPLLAGCFGDPPHPTAAAAFEGDAALDFVAGLVQDPQGSPRFRVPGTAGHAAAADWLWSALEVPGWTRHRQAFTGADYAGLDKGAADTYVTNPGYCSEEESRRLANLSFQNLWATRDGGSGSRTLLLAAHWESKRFASEDPDPARRGEPVLGANDGAAGVGLLLQLMRHLEQEGVELPFGVAVAFFDGEDGFEDCHPLAGSLYFVSQLGPGEVDRLLLLDMVGDLDARFIRESNSASCDPGLVDLLHDLAPARGLAANFPNRTKSVTDDHVPFLEAGIPAVDLIDFGRTGNRTQSNFGFPPYWHTTDDTLRHISPAMLGNVGGLVLDALRDERFVSTWPASC